jgi:amino acid transporter
MVFVLLTFGGWNEAAYLSAEVRDPRRNMVRVLVASIAVITTLYLAVNLALLNGLGLGQMARSEAVAADLMRRSLGEGGARMIAFLVVIAALSTINATMMTGARSAYALGRDFPALGFLGRWKETEGTPANALLLQGGIALLLVAAGAGVRSGFEAMVSYTAPVFWFFFLLTGLSLFVLRRREPATHRPFRVPLYPLLPLLFCLVCIAMLVSSLAYTGVGALAGAAVLLAGIPLFLWVRKGSNPEG